jgi:hypothetical protein
MRAAPEARSPAPRAADRASSNVFSSAGEHSEHTQHHRGIQAIGATGPSEPAPPAAISACDNLRFEVIIETSALAQRFARSATETAWRGDRLRLGTHLQEVPLSAITAIQIFKGLGQHFGGDSQTRGDVAK